MSINTLFRTLHGQPTKNKGYLYRLVGWSFLGLFLGNLTCKVRLPEQYSTDELIPYQNEQHINYLLDKTQLPVVVYYYYGGSYWHWKLRSLMKKYSHQCKGKALFVMCNIGQHYLDVTTLPLSRFNPDVMLEVRRHKMPVTIVGSQDQEEFEAYTTGTYSGDNTEDCFRGWLRTQGILGEVDQLLPMLHVASSVVYGE